MADTARKEHYIGSVRFFRHLFLLVLILMILVPTVLSIVFGVQAVSQRKATQALTGQLDSLQAQLQQQAAQYQAALDTAAPSPVQLPEEDELLPVAQEPDYTALYPDFYNLQPQPDSFVADSNVCYLTFDDGPSPNTDQVLRILEEEDVRATFFVVKADSVENRARLKAAADAGHTIGMHSASHDYHKIYSSVEAFLADYYELYTWIYEVTGKYPTVFRFPGGSINGYNRAIYHELIAEMTRRGFAYFDWNVSAEDAAATTRAAATIVRSCLDSIPKIERGIILLHDSTGKATTVAALPEVIQGYRDAGYTFAALSNEVKPIIFGYGE